jgi:phosphomannomutase / phosphoglucomutase
MQLNEKIFREYDIRGKADVDLTDEVVENLGRAVGSLVRRKKGRRFTVGRDCRLSSPRLSEALTRGLMASGLEVIEVGSVPTPLLYFSIPHLEADGGIMITGSHNPAEYNGFKVCIGSSTIHGDEIQALKHQLLARDFEGGQGTKTRAEVIGEYISFVLKNISSPVSMKVVVDSGNGMAGIVAPELYRKLGAEVIELFSDLDGSFPNHHPDPTELENLRFLIDKVKTSNALAGIGFDGDADRIGIVDQSGRVLFGDELLVLYARQVLKQHPGATIISEVKASHRLFQDIASHGGTPVLWKTGHSLIKAKMKETGALLAGEMSGHMFFKDRYFGYDDAIYAGARLLEILNESGKTASEMLADLPIAFSTPEIRVECPDEIKFSVVEKAKEALKKQGLKVNGIDGARVEFEDGWGLVRASNTQPVLVFRFEALSEKRLQEIRVVVESTVSGLLK